jgi:hypothetical protein
VRIETRALQDAGISPDLTISASLPSGFIARAALQITLTDVGLAPVVRRDVLVITTRHDAAHWRDETGLPEIMRRDTPLCEALEQVTVMRFRDATLSDVFTFCRETHEIAIRPDDSAFPNPAAVLQMPISVDLRGISVANALGFVLDDCNLRCVEKDGELLVQPRESTERTSPSP